MNNLKNLKINKKFISLITAGVITISLTGCSLTDDKNDTNDVDVTAVYQLYEGKLEDDIIDNVVTEDGLYDINNLSVINKNSKEKLDLTKIQVLVSENGVNTLMGIDRDLTLFLSDQIIAIYYDGKEISLKDYAVVDKNGAQVESIRQLFVDNKEVEFGSIKEDGVENLSMEQFDTAVAKLSCSLTNRGVNFVESDILKTAILINLPVLSNGVNAELFNELLIKAGNPDINGLISGYMSLINAYNNPYYDTNVGSNYKYFYEKGIPFEQLTHLGDLVLGKTQKSIYDAINNRLNTMSTMLDTYELDAEIVKLVNEIKEGLDNKGTYASIDNGTMLALSPRFADARGMIFMVCNQDDRCITPESQKAIKVVAPYTSEESEVSLYGYELFNNLSTIFNAKGNTKTLVK